MTQKISQYLIPIGVLLALIFAVAYLMGAQQTQKAEASVFSGQEYMATSTAGNGLFGGGNNTARLKTGYGALGSVVITGANTGIFNLYNATTSNVNLRAASMATSTILIASFPANAAAGTYTFDVAFTNGLFLDLVSGSMPTSTITYR